MVKKITDHTKILVALSGGVDSAVAAYLLHQQGYEVHAVFMRNFSIPTGNNIECPWQHDEEEAKNAARHLRIPLATWNFEREYHDRVVDYMVTEYERGRTPNPDVMCNTVIKFGAFLQRAKREGYGFIATGHYAGVRTDRVGVCHLLKGRDSAKDQSYFLAGLTQEQLRHVKFPLAQITKTRVRAIARRIGLPNAERKDSQGICFVGKVELSDFLKLWIKPRRGEIVDTSGRVLGYHPGASYFTIGQRRGLGLGGGPALYVVDKNVRKNQLVVGVHNQLDLFKQQLTATDWHWIAKPLPMPLRATAKIRYRQTDQPVILTPHARGKSRAGRGEGDVRTVNAVFARPQRAVSPGQVIAVYRDTELVASGIIQ